MPNNQFINLEELSITTQALLSKINEQSNLKVNKHNVSAEYSEGTKIAEIEDVEIYAPIQEIDTSNFVTNDDLSNVAYSGNYYDLDNKPSLATVAISGYYNDLNNKPDLSNYMVKGTDYVTAGQRTGFTLGDKATAEGELTTASGNNSHAEGSNTTASGLNSHAEGFGSLASGLSSHTEGSNTIASGNYSHAEGYSTTAQRKSQHVFGEYNVLDTVGTTTSRGNYIEIVGKGTATNARSNARTLDWNGNEVLAGKLTIGTAPTANMDVTTKQYVDNAVNGVTIPVTSVNEETGNVIISKIKTTAPSNNVEYNLMGTTSNNNTIAVSPYNQDLLSFAKTTDFSRLTIGSTSMPGKVRLYSSADSASGYTELKSNASSTNAREVTFPDASGTVALTTDIPNVPSWALAASKPSYTFSELTSHPTTLNDYGITNAYTKTEVDGLVSGVLHYKGTKSTTGVLPNSGNATGDVWHITADGSEWAWDGSDWQELGTAVDLSGYLQTGDIAAWAKAANKPTYTASEVGALPSSTSYVSSFNGATGAITYTAPVTSVNGNTGAVTITAASITAASATHAHGNLTSGGDITTTATIASGDRLVINDESASKITNSSITFGSSTSQFLANNGTWQDLNNSSLATRIAALENLEWATYYSGRSNPSNSQGQNGDIYLQY